MLAPFNRASLGWCRALIGYAARHPRTTLPVVTATLPASVTTPALSFMATNAENAYPWEPPPRPQGGREPRLCAQPSAGRPTILTRPDCSLVLALLR